MAIYWVNYDLRLPEQNYDALTTYLKSHSGWAKPAKSSFFVKTELTAAQLLEGARQHTDDDDVIVVVKVDGELWATSGVSAEVVGWMRRWVLP